MSPSYSAAANRAGLFAAYEEAKSQNAALYIPGGTYAIELAQPSTAPTVIALTDAPITGAGSSVTILEFEYPGSGVAVDRAFMTDDSVLALEPSAYARIEGLKLIGPKVLAGASSDGSDAPDCWAVYVQDGTRLRMIDVRTTLWKEAMRLEGGVSGTTAYLERCYIRSRSTRIRRFSPARPVEQDVLTLVNSTIEQDDDGFLQDASAVLHCGILQEASASLVVIGGASLGGRSRPYDIRQPPAADGGPSQVSVSDHFFGPNSRVGMHLSSNGAAVQVDNCTFQGDTGIILDGDWTVYHVSNCVFIGGRSVPMLSPQVLAESTRTYAGAAVRDSEAGYEVEAYFSNCKFGADLGSSSASSDQQPALSLSLPGTYDSTVVRYQGEASKAWHFSNCLFGGLRNPAGALFKAVDGVNLFRDCHFLDERQDGTYPIEQHAGRIELHGCRKDGKEPVYFPSDRGGLEVVLNQNVFRQDSILVVPTAAVVFRGAENEFGDYVEIKDPGGWFVVYGSVPVTSDMQLKRGPGRRREERWDAGEYYYRGNVVRNGDAPERVYECTDPGRTAAGPEGTASAITEGSVTWAYVRDDADYEYRRSPIQGPIEHLGETRDLILPVVSSDPYHGLSQLIISWNADWIEFDEYGEPAIQVVNIRSRRGGSYCNPLVGATVQIFAIRGFTLGTAGNIVMRGSSRNYPAGQVATLRYTSQESKWLLL